MNYSNNNNNSSFSSPFLSSMLESKLNDNFPLEDFLNDDNAILCIKEKGTNIKKYFNSKKIKQLIKYISEEPENNDYFKGYKFPYVACQILKLDSQFILDRFILNKDEYYNKYEKGSNFNNIDKENGIIDDEDEDYNNKKEIIIYDNNYENKNVNNIVFVDEIDEMDNYLEKDKEIGNIKEFNNDDKNNNIYKIKEKNNKIDNNNIEKDNKGEYTNDKKMDENFGYNIDVLDIKNIENINKEKEKEKIEINQNFLSKNKLNNENKILNDNQKEIINKIDSNIQMVDEEDSISFEEIIENKSSNEYFDLLLNFVMAEKSDLNDVLSGYFSDVIKTLLKNNPYKILNYLYEIRRDALNKIIFRSHQNSFSIIAEELLNLENYGLSETNSIKYRNELIGNYIKSLNLDGFIESKISLIINIISKNTSIVYYILEKDDIYKHILKILETNLYDDINYKNINMIYPQYCKLISLLISLLKKCQNSKLSQNQNEVLFKMDEINNDIINCLGKIIKYNFLPKNHKLIKESENNKTNNCLGLLIIKILDLVKEMFNFMKELSNELDSLLINNNFWERSINYFFCYQWNNIYHINFIQVFDLYLKEEIKHKELTDYIFQRIKFHEILLNFINSKSEKQNLNYEFKSGNKIKSGIYPQVIHLMYKINVISGLNTLTIEEKSNLKILNLGEFEFVQNKDSKRISEKINISSNIGNILKQTKNWGETMNNIIIPLIKKYEEGLYKKKKEKKYNKNNNNCIYNSMDILLNFINNSKGDFLRNEKMMNLILSNEYHNNQKKKNNISNIDKENNNLPNKNNSSEYIKIENKYNFESKKNIIEDNKKIIEEDEKLRENEINIIKEKENNNIKNQNKEKENVKEIKMGNENTNIDENKTNNEYNEC